MARRKAFAPPYKQSASNTSITTTTIATCGSASLQLDRINGRTASMAQVIGLNFAKKLIQPGMAVKVLEGKDLRTRAHAPWVARLRYAYADALLASGRDGDAVEWFHRAAAVDSEQLTDAAERLAELEGMHVVDIVDESADDIQDANNTDTPFVDQSQSLNLFMSKFTALDDSLHGYILRHAPEDEHSIEQGLRTAAQLPTPNHAARAAAEPHDVRRQAERIEAILERAARGRPA